MASEAKNEHIFDSDDFYRSYSEIGDCNYRGLTFIIHVISDTIYYSIFCAWQ